MVSRFAIALGLALLVCGCGPKLTYAQGCGPIPAGWITPKQGRGVLSTLSVISVATDGSVLWNGKRVSRKILSDYLGETSQLNPLPITQIEFASGVDCQTVAALRRLMVQKLNCKNGLCAEGDGKWWRIGDVVSPGKPNQPYDPDASPSAGND